MAKFRIAFSTGGRRSECETEIELPDDMNKEAALYELGRRGDELISCNVSGYWEPLDDAARKMTGYKTTEGEET